MTGRRRVGTTVAASLVLLVVALSGAAAAAPAQTTAASTAPTASAASSADVVVNQTHTVSLAPSEPDRVYIDTTLEFEDPDAFEDYEINYSVNHAYYMSSTSDFTRVGDEWHLKDGVTSPEFTTVLHTDNATYSGSTTESALAIFPLGNWATIRDQSGSPVYSVDRTTTFVPDGQGVFREDKVLLGPYDRHEETRNGTTFELFVASDATLHSQPSSILESVAKASEYLAGDDEDVSVFAVPSYGYVDVGGYAGDTTAVGLAGDPSSNANSVWLHEYVHTTDGFEKDPSTWWFTEGYADYEMAHRGLEQGQANWSQYRNQLEWSGTSTVATLSDHETWGDEDQNTDVYSQGSLALAYADLRIRQTSENDTLQDVVELLHEQESDADVQDFLGYVEQVSSPAVRDDVEQYVTTAEVPQLWSASTHEAAFGYDPTATQPDAQVLFGDTPVRAGEQLNASAFFSDRGDASWRSFTWDWGDGTTETTEGYNVQHVYDSPGQYEVELTVTDENGRSDTTWTTVTVTGAGPNVEITDAPTERRVGWEFRVEADATPGSGEIASYEWSFGDGTTGSHFWTTHTYDEPGSYELSVTVTDEHGQTATASRTVDVYARPPEVEIAGPSQIPAGDQFDAEANVTAGDGEIESYEWSLGDGETDTGQQVAHTYADAGTYDVELTVTDEYGNVATDTRTVEATGDTTQPHGEIDQTTTSASVGESVSFGIDQNTDYIPEMQWSMGDGKTYGRDYWVTHAYDSPGTYTVTLETKSGYDGSWTTDTVTIEVT